MRKGLLEEVLQSPVEVLEEAKPENQHRMRVKAKLMESDTRNRNNRVYKSEIVAREVGRLQERIKNGIAFGSGDHPADGRTSLDNVVALWQKVWPAGKEVFGEAIILNTDRGKNLQEIIRAAGSIPVSARGFGTVNPGEWEGQPAEIVEDSYQLVTFDFVLNAQGFEDAKVTQVREEKGGGAMDLKELKEKHPDLVKALTDEVAAATKAEVEKTLIKAFEEKILAKIAEEKAVITEAVKKELGEELEALREVLEEIGVLVAPFMGDPEKKEKTQTADKAVKEAVAAATAELDKVGQGLKEQLAKSDERVKTLEGELEQARVPAYIADQVKTEARADLLLDDLKDCKSRKEVDARLPGAKAKLQKLFETVPELKGKGTVQPEGDKGKPELTEEQKRERKLAGLHS